MRFALLTATQRSGTGALGSILDQHPEIKYVGEVFHPSNIGDKHNYFTHLKELVSSDPELALPDAKQQNFESFISELQKEYPEQLLVVDVKYRSLHHLDGGWHGVGNIPWILQYAKTLNNPIIHLQRKNLAQTFVSGRLAEENQVWHATSTEDAKIKSTVVDVGQMSRFLVQTDREMNQVGAWLKNYNKLIEIEYANMLNDNGELASSIDRELQEIIWVSGFESIKPRFKKQAPKGLKGSVENYELVKKALTGTEYEWMVT